MTRKMLVTCVSLLAFAAFGALPALASASKNLVVEGGVVGETFWAKSTKLEMIGESPSSAVFTCQGELTGKSLANSTTSGSTATISTADFYNTTGSTGSHCAANVFGVTMGVTSENLPWCLRSITNEDRGTLDGGDCVEHKALKFTLHLTVFGAAAGTCTYEADHAVASVAPPSSSVAIVPSTATFKKAGSCTTETAQGNTPATAELAGQLTMTKESDGAALTLST
jgi:hypothetical protein